MTQDEAADMAVELYGSDMEDPRLLRALYRRAGVKTRHTVVPHRAALQWATPTDTEQSAVAVKVTGPSTRERMTMYADNAPQLACAAAREAIVAAKADVAEITHLVTVSCTGFAAPGVDVSLMRELELSPTVERTHVGFMGCHGAINGMRVARALATSEPESTVLLCAVELCSLHYCFSWDPARAVGNAIFADGAAAVVASGTSEAPPWRVIGSASCLIPDAIEAMSWQIGDHGFDMFLSSSVPDLIGRSLRPWLTSWLSTHGLSVDDVASWAVHPGGPRIVGAVEEVLGLDREQTSASRQVLRDYGNMSSPTVLFILNELKNQQAALPCVAIAFGPGLVAEALLLA
jgi:predicted naringenin-chalcone synthase